MPPRRILKFRCCKPNDPGPIVLDDRQHDPYSANTITIPAGERSALVVLTGLSNEIEGSAETVVADVAGMTNGRISGAQRVTATIDLPAIVTEARTPDGRRYGLFSNRTAYNSNPAANT